MRILILHICFCLAFSAASQNVFAKIKRGLALPNPVNELFVLDSCYNKNYYRDSALYYKTLVNIKIKKIQSAQRNVKMLVKLFPDFKEIHYLNGLIYFSNESYGKCITEFNLAIKDDPKNMKVLYNRAIAFGLIDEYLSAIEDVSTCIQLNPDYAQAYYSRAYWYEYTGNYPGAVKDYESAVRLDPHNYEAYIGLANVYRNQNDMARACEAINNAVKEGSQTAAELKEDFCR